MSVWSLDSAVKPASMSVAPSDATAKMATSWSQMDVHAKPSVSNISFVYTSNMIELHWNSFKFIEDFMKYNMLLNCISSQISKNSLILRLVHTAPTNTKSKTFLVK